ncbi:hypothetical protein E2562_019552 [Oryza meyeriana var. granulata]|uniref:Uncharacterized protein n=1 Tax=Oryza meyeriana var. granulata TaxID=110450 RepID=A0A6G1BZ16_9ORYZ|nr:hypothetical protein E2562_019552 [Oryza meyeriana var. granulata]
MEGGSGAGAPAAKRQQGRRKNASHGTMNPQEMAAGVGDDEGGRNASARVSALEERERWLEVSGEKLGEPGASPRVLGEEESIFLGFKGRGGGKMVDGVGVRRRQWCGRGDSMVREREGKIVEGLPHLDAVL